MFSTRTKELLCTAGLSPLPIVELETFRTDSARIWLKKEWEDPNSSDPLRSIKRKPACLLTSDLLEKAYVGPGQVAISATSGNLGIEIGLLSAALEFPFFAVVPAATPEYNLKIMQEIGINIIQTTELETCPREFTVFFVRGYAHEFHHKLVNIEQYYSWLNPLAHSATTAHELFEGFHGTIDHVVASVGSCGTVGGIRQYMIASGTQANLVGAQPAVGQGVPGTHIIKGDCKWSPENYSPVVLPGDNIQTVDAADSFAFTAKLWQLGIQAGPSTGMALALAYRMVRQGASGNIVITSPDNNFKYGDLIREKLADTREEIIARYPELEIDDTIDEYVKHLEESYSLAWTLEQVRKHYPVTPAGRLFQYQDIEDIVKSTFNAPRLQRVA
jgi:cysteine synthase B